MNRTLLKLTLLSVSLLLMGSMSIAPVLGVISQAFPAATPTQIQMLIALPGLVLIPFSILSGGLATRFPKRPILWTGLVVFLLGGIAPIWARGYGQMLFLRVVFGVGLGIITPFASGLIADFFEGQERAKLIGFQSAVVSFGAILTSLLAGLLGVAGWRNAFWVYLIAVPVLVLTLVGCPEPPRSGEPGEKAGPNGPVFLIAAWALLYALCYFTFFTNTALLIQGENLGTAAASGIAITLMTVGGLMVGMGFGAIHRLCGRFTPVLSLFLTALGFLVLAQSSALAGVFVGALVIGAGFGITMPFMTLRVTQVAPRPAITLSLAIMLSFVNIGSFISPPIFVGLGGVLGHPGERFTFLLTTLFLAFAAVVTLVKLLVGRSPVPGSAHR
ncbi:MFS transporter [Holophaga foetida]|uniref:MFS transporter n=1 Tax=Holophaga foetida TaxID=35839 RepID=UPI0002474D74|nr:MFS transporter [Holophaga foetida]